ncbi:MAG TPA: ATP-binding protein, partial [Caldilineaceae bacterium]|nr:ATP-binding protein [Caldilineaceae bacterium]
MAVSPFDTPVISPALIGRTQELETLDYVLQAAQRGLGQCILLAGDAGIGKSRLLRELCHRASAAHFLTLQGYCFEQDSSFPYAPLVDAL